MTNKLPDPKRMAPIAAFPDAQIGDNWMVLWCAGNSNDDGCDWHIATDRVRASELIDVEFPSDAKSDAKAIAAIVNAYRTGRLVEVGIDES